MEIVRLRDPGVRIEHILFDFDGTLSVIRQGWQDVMISYFVEVLNGAPRGPMTDDLPGYVREWVYELTGKQTIYQMLRLVDEVKKRGGIPREPLDYKREYLHLLWEQIEHRVRGLRTGEIAREDMVIAGAHDLLAALRERGAVLYLASGTDEVYVRDEASALGLGGYFCDRMYGALDDYRTYSKAIVIDRILETNGIDGRGLAVFGDGYVEIENAKQVGGTAIGVASDEVRRRGIDEWKRERLLRVGADAIIGDYADVPAILSYLYD
jgi:phosphoglycolate phosphatase